MWAGHCYIKVITNIVNIPVNNHAQLWRNQEPAVLAGVFQRTEFQYFEIGLKSKV